MCRSHSAVTKLQPCISMSMPLILPDEGDQNITVVNRIFSLSTAHKPINDRYNEIGYIGT